jgi:hypothetical protein
MQGLPVNSPGGCWAGSGACRSVPHQRRPLLREALDAKAVRDGVIQGDSLRLLTDGGRSPTLPE